MTTSVVPEDSAAYEAVADNFINFFTEFLISAYNDDRLRPGVARAYGGLSSVRRTT